MRHPCHSQRGTTLFEALIAFLVLSLGLIAIARVHVHLRLAADIARERSEAVRLAQDEIDTLRGIATPAAFDALASASRTVGSGHRIERAIAAAATPRTKTAVIVVSWVDRSGAAQHLTLHTIVADADAALSGSLALR